MGCEQSIPVDVETSFEITKPALVSRQSTTGMPIDSSARTSSSVSTDSSGVDEDPSYLPKVDHNGHLLTEEIVRRTSSSIQCSSLMVGEGKETFELQYAFRSQRGYNPRDPFKPNMEKYGITLNFASEGTGAMMGVFSGRGEEGQQCASFCNRVLPQQLAKFIRQKRVQRYKEKLQASSNAKQGAWNPKMWPILSTNDYEQCCRRAFQETNNMLHREQEINDRLSGASVASVCFHGGRMYVCNVGDCKVVLGRRRADECTQYSNQCRNYDGEEEKCEIEEDTRSMGHYEDYHSHVGRERIAITLTENQEIGMSDPDVLSCDLTATEDIVVIASNGVFEFLTEQEVIDICISSSNPLEASENVTRAAYHRWIEHEDRCEDITAIVGILSSKNKETSSPGVMVSSVDVHVPVMVDVAEEEW